MVPWSKLNCGRSTRFGRRLLSYFWPHVAAWKCNRSDSTHTCVGCHYKTSRPTWSNHHSLALDCHLWGSPKTKFDLLMTCRYKWLIWKPFHHLHFVWSHHFQHPSKQFRPWANLLRTGPQICWKTTGPCLGSGLGDPTPKQLSHSRCWSWFLARKQNTNDPQKNRQGI